MKHFYLILLYFISGSQIIAQDGYSRVMEGYYGAEFYTIEDKGVVVSYIADKANGKEKEIIFEFLDLQLNPMWTVKSTLDKSSIRLESSRLKYSSDNFLHIIFNINGEQYKIYSLNIEKQTCSIAPFELSKKEYIRDMVAINELVFFRTDNELFSVNSKSQRLSKVPLSLDSQRIKLKDLIVMESKDYTVTEGTIKKGPERGYYVFITDISRELVAKLKVSTDNQHWIEQVSCAMLDDGSWLIYGVGMENFAQGLFIKKFNGNKLTFNKFLPYPDLLKKVSSVQNSEAIRAFHFSWHEMISTPNGLIFPAEVIERVGTGNYSSCRNTHVFSLCLNTDGETQWTSHKEFPEPNFYEGSSGIKFTTIIADEEGILSFIRHVDLTLIEKYSLDNDGELFQEKITSTLTELNPCSEIKSTVSIFHHLNGNSFIIITIDKGKLYKAINEYCLQAINF